MVKENGDGNLGVNYAGIIPVLLQAIKQQQQQIDEFKIMLMNVQEKIK